MVKYPGNWISTKSLEEMANTTYDVLIIGTGHGGGTVLSRLCELWRNNGAKKIGILERGDKLFHSHSLNIPTMNINTASNQLLEDNSTSFKDRLPEFSGARMVYALGGRSLFWNCTVPRPIESELRKWPINYRELEAYYSMAEKSLNASISYSKGSSMQNLLLRKLYSKGILEARDLPLAFDMEASRKGQIHSNPWYSSINKLASAQYNRDFDLGLNAYVSRVLTEDGKIFGVEVFSQNKDIYIIPAKNVVLSASTLETPRILLNSNINVPAIGHYLTEHVSIIAVRTISRGCFSENLGNLSILKAETEEAPYQIQIIGPNQYFSYQQFENKNLQNELTVILTAFGRVESRPENRVYIDSSAKDEFGMPLIQVNYSLSDRDYEVVNQMSRGIVEAANAMGIALNPATVALRPPGSSMHESCTCRIGTNPETSAANPHGQIHGIEGLFVADNSALPSLSASGPTISNIALSMRVADYIYLKET